MNSTDQKPQTKAEWRQLVRLKTQRLPASYFADSDSRIRAHLLSLPEWKATDTLFIYISVGTEPDTRALIKAAWQAGKRVAVPRCMNGGNLEARLITSFDGLTQSHFNLLEPDEAFPLVPPEALHLVIAPCVAMDRSHHRLGHGGGFYDRYLAKVQCPVVCLCRHAFLFEALPADRLDVAVATTITEQGVFVAK